MIFVVVYLSLITLILFQLDNSHGKYQLYFPALPFLAIVSITPLINIVQWQVLLGWGTIFLLHITFYYKQSLHSIRALIVAGIALTLSIGVIPGIPRLALFPNEDFTINLGKALAAILLGSFLFSIRDDLLKAPIKESWLTHVTVACVITLIIVATMMLIQKEHWNHHNPMFVYLFLANLSITCVAEELFFRGFLLHYQLKIFSVPIALIINSIIFGLVHLPMGLKIAIPAFFAGLLYGAIYLKTSRFSAAILTHSLVNIPLLLAL